MKILHVIPKLPINMKHTVIGGAANALVNLAEEQRGQGEDVQILSHFPLLGAAGEDFLRANGLINLNMMARQNSRAYGAEFTMRTFLASVGRHKEFDIVHGHSGHIDYVLAVRLASRMSHGHLVYSLYCPVTFTSRVTRYPMRNEILKALAKNVRFIAISRNVADSLDYLELKNKVYIIPPAIDLQKFYRRSDKKTLRMKYGLDPDQPILLFVGNHSQSKNMECVLQAFKKVLENHPKACLIVTTELHIERFSERETYLNRLIDDLEIRERIMPVGITDAMPQLMQLADVLVAPFRDTDGPSDYFLAALEAMCVGTPAFVSPVGGMREVVDGSNSRFIDPEKPEQLAAELECFFADSSLAEEMGVRAAKTIKERFSPVVIEKQVKDVYSEVIQNAD